MSIHRRPENTLCVCVCMCVCVHPQTTRKHIMSVCVCPSTDDRKTHYVCVCVCPSTDNWKTHCVCVCTCVHARARVLSPAQLFAAPWTVAHQAPLSIGLSRQEYWSGLLFPSLGDLPAPGIENPSPVSRALAGRFFTTNLSGKSYIYKHTMDYCSAIKL